MGGKAERRAKAHRLQVDELVEAIASLGYDSDMAATREVAEDLVHRLAEIRRAVKDGEPLVPAFDDGPRITTMSHGYAVRPVVIVPGRLMGC